jgi:hypothetical protein
MRRQVWGTTRLPLALIPRGRLSASGGSASSSRAWSGSRKDLDEADQESFPPDVMVAVKALACELPHEHGIPVSRLSTAEIRRAAVEQGIVASIGGTTVWRWLSEDAIRPWCHRSWVFPRDPRFAHKAGLVLDLYAGSWRGKPLRDGDYVISADEKTSIQTRRRRHKSLPPRSGRAMRVEHEYQRCGAWAYLAAWDVRRARLFGRCEKSTGIAPFERLVQQVMQRRPYCQARRVFWILDNGSSHRGESCIRRLQQRWPKIIPVHTPIHASWLNQIEIYFSIVQRKVLTPNDFKSLLEVQDRLYRFEKHYQQIAKPFQWKFTRRDLARLLAKIDAKPTRRKTA